MKKALSSITATALLLIVTVVTVVGFQSWFQDFSSNLVTDIEQRDSTSSISIEALLANILYLKSSSADTIEIFKVKDSSGNLLCEIEDDVESSLQADTRLLFTFDNSTYNNTHVQDLSGYSNNATIFGTLSHTNTSCLSSDCFNFQDNSDYLNITDPSTINGLLPLSINFWFKKNDTDPNCSRLLGLRNSSFYFYVINFGEGCTGTIDNEMLTLARFDISGNIIFGVNESSTDFNDLEWHMISVIINGNHTKVYFDSSLQTTVNGQNEDLGNFVDLSGTYHLAIGENTNGRLDEYSIYSKELSSAEIKALFDSRKAKFYEQLLGEETKGIDLSSCNINKGQKYEITLFTGKKSLSQTIFAR